MQSYFHRTCYSTPSYQLNLKKASLKLETKVTNHAYSLPLGISYVDEAYCAIKTYNFLDFLRNLHVRCIKKD